MSIILGAIAVGGTVAAWATVRKLLAKKVENNMLGLAFTRPAEDYAPATDEHVVDPTVKPGTARFRDWVLKTQGGFDDGILGDVRHMSEAASGHKSGIAWDWGHIAYKDHAAIDPKPFIDALLANNAELARRAGLRYIISNHQIWTAGTKQWSPYSGADPHTAHVHFSFGMDGAMGRTSLFDAIA